MHKTFTTDGKTHDDSNTSWIGPYVDLVILRRANQEEHLFRSLSSSHGQWTPNPHSLRGARPPYAVANQFGSHWKSEQRRPASPSTQFNATPALANG